MAMMRPAAAVAAAALALLVASSALQPRSAVRAQIAAAPSPSPWAAPAPWPGSLDCAPALLNLTPCLTYVEVGSPLTRPEKGCCGALAGVLDGEAACLCGLVGGYAAYGVRVDTVRALALPTICRVDSPPPRLCAALGIPVAEPPGGAVPAESGYDIPASTPATAGGGGPAAPGSWRARHLLPCCLALITLLL